MLLVLTACLLGSIGAMAAIPSFAPINGPVFPSSNKNIALRHCNYVCSGTPIERGNADFNWVLVPALNGAPAPAVSFQSANFPDHYLAIVDVGAKTLGIAATPNVDDASWTLTNPLGPSMSNLSYSIRSLSKGALANLYVTVDNQNTAPCGFAPPSGDAILTDGVSSAAAATWTLGYGPQNGTVVAVDAATVVNPAVNKRFMGCHSDYGFAQTPRGFTSNLLYGSSFEKGTMAVPSWTTFSTAAGSNIGLNTGCAFSAKSSMGVSLPTHAKASDEAGLANRGLGGQGFAFQGGKPYSLEVYAYPDQDCTMFAELRDFETNTVLARETFKVTAIGPPWGSNWNNYSLTLTPSASTTCVGIPFGSDPSIDCGGEAGDAEVCVRCAGEFRIGVVGPAAVNIGFVNLQPGPWGLVAKADGSGYLPVLKSAGDTLTAMGITVIRSGGTVSQSMRWKDWRGSVWNRPSQQQVWGDSLLSGWGPFEVIDMCNALGIEPIVTLAYDTNDAMDFADLVEYCWGDAKTTTWGRRRAADGHPAVYNITVFELGNEQYNPVFIEQVQAMEERSRYVNSPPLHYMFPENGGMNAADAQRALDLGLPITRIMPDIHVGAGGAVGAAADLFAHPPVPGFNQSAINCETNAGTHDMQRALDEAADLITWFTADTSVTNRIYARTASFCSGTSMGFDSWNQGISFFLPNMTWFQPPGYVHTMFTATWAEQTLASNFETENTVPFAAQRTADGSQLVLRIVNDAGSPQPLTIKLAGAQAVGNALTVWTITGAHPGDDNTPSLPTKISPVKAELPIASPTQFKLTLPPYTVASVVVPLK